MAAAGGGLAMNRLAKYRVLRPAQLREGMELWSRRCAGPPLGTGCVVLASCQPRLEVSGTARVFCVKPRQGWLSVKGSDGWQLLQRIAVVTPQRPRSAKQAGRPSSSSGQRGGDDGSGSVSQLSVWSQSSSLLCDSAAISSDAAAAAAVAKAAGRRRRRPGSAPAGRLQSVSGGGGAGRLKPSHGSGGSSPSAAAAMDELRRRRAQRRQVGGGGDLGWTGGADTQWAWSQSITRRSSGGGGAGGSQHKVVPTASRPWERAKWFD